MLKKYSFVDLSLYHPTLQALKQLLQRVTYFVILFGGRMLTIYYILNDVTLRKDIGNNLWNKILHNH